MAGLDDFDSRGFRSGGWLPGNVGGLLFKNGIVAKGHTFLVHAFDSQNIAERFAFYEYKLQVDNPTAVVFGFVAGVLVFDFYRIAQERFKIGDIEAPGVFPCFVESKSVGRNKAHDFPIQGIVEIAFSGAQVYIIKVIPFAAAQVIRTFKAQFGIHALVFSFFGEVSPAVIFGISS